MSSNIKKKSPCPMVIAELYRKEKSSGNSKKMTEAHSKKMTEAHLS